MDPYGQEAAAPSRASGVAVGDEPELSIVLLLARRYAWLRRTVREWATQTGHERIEAIVVRPARLAGEAIEAADFVAFHSWRVVEIPELDVVATGFAAGVRAARADHVMLAEDHAFPEPGLAAAVLAAFRADPGLVAVGPCMANDNPDTEASQASFIVAFSASAFASRDRPARQLGGHNAAYPRRFLLDFGDELAELYKSERNLQYHIETRGERMRLLARPRMRHVNSSRWTAVIDHAYQGGRLFAGMRARGWGVLRRAVYVLGSPLIPLVRLRRILAELRESPAAWRATVPRRLPALLALLLVHAFGELTGYLLGSGAATTRYAPYELYRRDQLTRRDLAAIDAPPH